MVVSLLTSKHSSFKAQQGSMLPAKSDALRWNVKLKSYLIYLLFIYMLLETKKYSNVL